MKTTLPITPPIHEPTALLPGLTQAPINIEAMVTAEVAKLINPPRRNLMDHLMPILLGGGTELFSLPVRAFPVFQTLSTCGYKYAYQNKMVGEIQLSITSTGLFMVTTLIQGKWTNHFYNSNGSYSHTGMVETSAQYKNVLMEPACPILNYIYNALEHEYSLTEAGTVNTKRIHTLENLLKKVYQARAQELSISKGIQHSTLAGFQAQMAAIEMDPILSWKERYKKFKAIRKERDQILSTKCRAHKIIKAQYWLPLWAQDVRGLFARFAARPINNTLGVVERVLLDPVRFLVQVVKNNMGFSIAMAIYSPFTFFFITQPMNPHAMWAVGKVRSAYIETVALVDQVIGSESKESLQKNIPTQSEAAINTTQATSKNEAVKKVEAPLSQVVLNNPSALVLTTDAPEVNKQDWATRMSNFKAMQIAYEGNLEIAPRLGRIEQMETQLNWPLQIESTWLETKRYIAQINSAFLKASNMNPQLFNYLMNERARAEQIQLYLWDRNIRFILDHPYTMLDESKEQTQWTYYIGRAFILLKDMTQDLKVKNAALALPQGYERIEQLAKRFEQDYKSGNSVLERLRNNSKLFQQANTMDSQELRNYMKRHWEVLYLLQNKAQEAANNGLQAYVWSVRQATWVLQSTISAKRDELSALALEGVNVSPAHKQAVRINSSQLEALHHMMVLEFASLRKEIGESLPQDIEAKQRAVIIESNESSLKERDLLLKELKLI